MLAFVLVLVIVRLIAGAIARLLVPGRDPVGILATIASASPDPSSAAFLQNLIQYRALSAGSGRPDRPVAGAIVLLLRLAGNAAATTPQPVPTIAD
jgi:hypothetical protein